MEIKRFNVFLKLKQMKQFFVWSLILFNLLAHGQFEERLIESVSTNLISIDLEDIDNDGDIDIVVTDIRENLLKWYENTNGLGDFSIVHDIFIDDFGLSYGIDLTLIDINNDNALDILFRYGEFDYSEVRAYLNTDGLGDFGYFHAGMNTFGLTSPLKGGY